MFFDFVIRYKWYLILERGVYLKRWNKFEEILLVKFGMILVLK